MNHSDFEEPAPEGVRRLLSNAFEEGDVDGWPPSVVPAVLAGYEQGVRTRRYQTMGSCLAVVAVAAAAVSLLPRGHDRAHTLSLVAPTTKSKPSSTPDFANHGCVQHWLENTRDIMNQSPSVDHPPSVHSQAANTALCQAFTAAVEAAIPGAQVFPTEFPDLSRDPRVDQTLLKQWNQEVLRLPAGHLTPPDMSQFKKVVDTETTRLEQDPADPANYAAPDHYIIKTAAGSSEYTLQYAATIPTGGSGAEQHPYCDPGPNQFPCTPFSLADGSWDGAIHVETVGLTYTSVAFEDAAGHFVALYTQGSDPSWVETTMDSGQDNAQGGPVWVDADGHTYDQPQFKNVYTGETRSAQYAPAGSQLTAEQLKGLFMTSGFEDFLDKDLSLYAGFTG